MKSLRVFIVALVAIVANNAMAQTWSTAYASGLKAARALKWTEARQAFLQAAAIRPEDASAPTTLPGPINERRQWREGSAYSPNFLAAYSAFRQAYAVKDEAAQSALLHTAAEELQMLVNKGQISAATLYYLNAVYTRLGDTEKQRALIDKASGSKMDWRVDTEVVDPQELAQIDSMISSNRQVAAQAPQGREPNAKVPVQNGTKTYMAGQQPGSVAGPETPTFAAAPTAILGPVAQNPNKFALLIGNSDSRIADQAIPFAGDDAQKIRETLVTNGGYLESNIDLVLNATSDQILSSAKALADRIQEGSTVFLFFSGVGTNIEGKDYLAGIDAESLSTSQNLVAKNDIYRLFMAKGAHIFAFYQVNRTYLAPGRYFGMEVPMVGSISQCQATSPGDKVESIIRNGKAIGVYTDAFDGVLSELRSNRVPINEFGWQIFYRVRRGDTGTQGGGSRQTPTLPVLTNMAADARF